MKKNPIRHMQGEPWLDCRLMLVALICVSGVLAPSASAYTLPPTLNNDTAQAITGGVWRLKYGVSDADLADQDWLDADSDGDGLTNGSEIGAGTNPFLAAEVVKIESITTDGTYVTLTVPTTVLNKKYVVQGAMTLTSFTYLESGPPLGPTFSADGSGGPITLRATQGANKFFRVLVHDLDADGDSASDWAEVTAGYNPNDSTTNGSAQDAAALAGAIPASNVVTVSVTKSNALQPADASSAPVETGAITISRSGPLRFTDIVVPLQKFGTAVAGADYESTDVPASVTFAKAANANQGGASEVVLKINPRYNSTRKTNVTAIVKALAGAGYTLGPVTSGAVVINPTGIADGTGLTGRYYANASINYSSGNNFGVTTPGELKLTQPGEAVDFTSPYNASTNPTGWDVPAPATTRPITTITGVYSIRWTGQVLPQYSETYSFDFRSREGGKLWVNGHLLIDNWTTQTATDRINSIALKAGVLYDIKVEYFNGGASPEARLYWWSPSRPKQIIPKERLFPDPGTAKPTAITSSLAAIGYEGTSFLFNVTSADVGAATTYALAVGSGPLPPGLTLSSTGAITGIPTLAGHYNVAIDATNTAAAAVTGSSVLDITIFPVGGVTREILATTGSSVSQIVIPTGDPVHTTISTIDDNADHDPNTGKRLRGYIVPPKTGNYYFWIAASNQAELWISNDSQYVNKVLRASVTATTAYKTWNALDYDHDSNASTPPIRPQQSPWLSLVAGEKYYFEVLHNTGAVGDDHVAVGWCQDDIGTVPSVVGAPNPTGVLTSIPNGGGQKQGYPYSGTVPGFVCQPYDYPVVTPPTGTLYACNLGPQGVALTSASGSASLQLNAAKTKAILHFSYQNLGSARIAYHLHTDGFTGTDSVQHNATAIVFDIDDADAIESQQTGDGGYIWDLAPIGDFTSIPQLVEAIETGKIYINIHSAVYPAGEIRGNFSLIEGSQTPPDPALYAEPAATDSPTNVADAARFLNQATFGASPTEVGVVTGGGTNGFDAWITNQLAKPASHTSGDVVAGITSDINSPYPSTLFTNTWWKYSITGEDQLRQRLAFALSEIMVVSWANDSGPLANRGRILADYYDQLVDYCLPTVGLADSGNFRGILKAVTLTPAMGRYLDMRANQKGDVTIGRIPNENYAREIMQLFSIGLYRMWDDGRFVLGSDAGLVPTYTQPSIVGLANLLTGWNDAQANQANGRAPTSFSSTGDELNPMVLVPNYHELSSKLLLNRVVSPEATGRTPRVNISNIAVGSPACTVTTATVHGLKTGDTIIISGVVGGAFTGGLAAINNSFQATVTSTTAFTVPVECSGAVSNQGTVTGATVTPPAYTTPAAPLAIGVPPVPGSQADNSGTGAGHPFDQYGLKELDLAIDNIVNNDNVPPYICRQLIQRLVTSDPSPGYVYRVVQKFKNNGSGVRGDLAAVVRQILMDGEARRSSVTQNSTSFGKQREPMLRLTGVARAFPATGYTGTYTQLTGTSANKLRITTSPPHDFSPNFTVSLDFHDNSSLVNPTSTAYAVQNTTAIAATHLDISTITPNGSNTIMTTTKPHGRTGTSVNGWWFFGLSGKFSDAGINSGNKTATVTNATTFTVPMTTTYVFQIQSVSVASPCVVTTVNPHGLPGTEVTGVTLNGVTGGTYSGATATNNFNGTNYTVARTGTNTFTVKSSAGTPVNCTVAPTSYVTWRETTNPGVVTTQVAHGLSTGDTVTISGVTGGSNPNGTFTATVLDSTSFTVPFSVATYSTPNTGSVTSVNGGTALEVNATGMVNASYTQTAGSSTITVSTQGPQTDVSGPSGTVKSKVYLMFLSQTNAGGGGMPANGIYEVQSVSGTTSFTVTGADTLARSGQVLMPRIQTSYTPQSGNLVQFNNNVNHNLVATNHVWVDVPIITTPLADGEFTITTVVDEDHFKTSNKPDGYSAAAAPSGSTNSVNIYPLVAPPTGRSGVVKINSSTFSLNSTEATLTQSPLNAPTVFNYFLPDYKFPGTLANNGLDSPEFQLSTDTNLTNLTNSLTNIFIGTGGGNGNLNGLSSFNNGGGAVVMNIDSYMTDAKTAEGGISGLIDELANLLVGTALLPATKTEILNFVNHKNGSSVLDYLPYTAGNNQQKRDRVRAIIHLIITSAEYAVQK